MSLRSKWSDFKASEPGRRFQDFYEQRKKDREDGQTWKRFLYVGLGLAFTVAGIIFLGMPGPGLLVIGLGLGLIAGESEVLARGLDRLEVGLRKIGGHLAEWWRRLRPWQRGILVLACLLLALTAAWAVYEVVF